MRVLQTLPALICFTFACGEAYDVHSHQAVGDHGHSDDGTRGETVYQNIPIVDQGAAQNLPAAAAPAAGAVASVPAGAAATPPVTPAPTCPADQSPAATAAASGQDSDAQRQRATVREYIRKLMDETRIVPDTAARKGGPRGSPGSFAKLSAEQVEEFISAVIDGARLFMPKSLTDEQRWALVCAEISIESAFTPGTSGENPGDKSKLSVGPLQLTLQMWDNIFRQYAQVPGLTHYNGQPWDPKDTSEESLKYSIYNGVVASLWCITEQGRRGCPEWFGGPDGPLPRTMHTAFLAWVIGAPALKEPGGDLAGQRDMYIASIETDLKLLGFDISLINTAF